MTEHLSSWVTGYLRALAERRPFRDARVLAPLWLESAAVGVRAAGQARLTIQMAAELYPRLVVIGPPGAGKTSVLRQLACGMAEAMLAEVQAAAADARPRQQPAPLPIYLELARFSGGAGVLVLLLACLVGPAERRETTLGMAAAQAVISGVAAWVLGPGGGAALLSRSGHADQQRRYDEALRSLDWHRLNLAVINTAASLDELARRVAERAITITRMPATAELGADQQAPHAVGASCLFHIPIACGQSGLLRVQMAPDALDPGQREALENLAAIAGLRAGELRAAEQLQRQQDGVMALWEAVGVVRAAPGLDDTMRDAFRRIARALGLDWLALVGPGERQVIAPLMIVAGTDAAETPRMQGGQLRVAAEAMRAGQPLVRTEGGVALACLPMRLGNDTPLVLVARGNTSEAGTQALLMVFGDLVAAHVGG